MRSWSLSGWACAPIEAPLRVGYVAPSRCVMKYPLGLFVITATCNPGLPIVVRFLVRSRVRPAAAHESTWITASRNGVPPGAGALAAAAGAAGAGSFGRGGGGGGGGGGGRAVRLGPGGGGLTFMVTRPGAGPGLASGCLGARF